MARATRSSATQEKDKPQDPAPPQRKNAKKRKRTSLAEASDEPALKQARTDDGIKEEHSTPEQETSPAQESICIDLPSSGDVPIQPSDAEKIVEILQTLDTQGLLDRVVPLASEAYKPGPEPASSATPASHTFRDLLQNASTYPTRTLRAAAQSLVPSATRSRARPTPSEVDQRRFLDLAIALLDQASSHNAPVPLNVDSIVSAYVSATAGPSGATDESQPSTKVTLTSPVDTTRKTKYALVQRLPTGDWWSSASADVPSDDKPLSELQTGRAELAAILPSASAGAGVGKTLGEYVTKKPSMLVQTASYLQHSRRIPCGGFLDYGPYASFAPSFDQDAREVGRVGLGEVIWHEDRKRRLRELAQKKQKALLARLAEKTSTYKDSEIQEITPTVSREAPEAEKKEPNVEALDGLLSSEQITELKSTLGSLELEQAVDELLDRNARAMARLEELQLQRLGGPDGGSSKVDVGSEEWEIAQSIIDSLTILASLRPRSSKDVKHPPLIPTTSALRKLHRTLPSESHGGWWGTLPSGRASALRDDNTLHVRPSVAVPAPAATPATPMKTVTPTPTAQYSGYTYTGYQTGQYRGGYGTYTPGQTTNYYNYPTAQQTTTTTANYYPNSQYQTTAAAGQQQQYSYGTSWHNYQPHTATATSSGRATPQPAAATTPVSTNYTSYYASAATQQPQPQRAVTNTVLNAAAATKYQPATWPNGGTATATTGYAASAVPAHLRPVATPTSPQTSTSYYSGYAAATPR